MNKRHRKPHGPRQSRRRAPGGQEWIYGKRPVLEALRAAKRGFHELWLADSSGHRHQEDDEFAEIIELAQHKRVACRLVQRDTWRTILGDSTNHQGVALLAGSFAYAPLDEILAAMEAATAGLVLILDHIEDPQNLGSLLRSADAAGALGVIIPEDRAAGVTPAAVRASAGAAEYLPVARTVNLARAIEKLKELNCWVTGLTLEEGAKPFTEIDFSGRCALVVGNEGVGLGRLVRERCDFIAVLPMLGRVGSLNAGVAGAVAMYEVVRQQAGL